MTRIEEKYLEFRFSVENVQFNHAGRFYLRLSIVNSCTDDYGKVRVWEEGSKYFIPGKQALTDVLYIEPRQFYVFEKNHFKFFLPKGFCKNDNKHDVYIQVEAFDHARDDGSSQGAGRRVGEAIFAIYPRTNAPKVKQSAPPETDMYKASNVMTLLRTLSTENIKMHCGRLKYTAGLRELRKPPKDPLTASQELEEEEAAAAKDEDAESPKSTARDNEPVSPSPPLSPDRRSPIPARPKVARTPVPKIGTDRTEPGPSSPRRGGGTTGTRTPSPVQRDPRESPTTGRTHRGDGSRVTESPVPRGQGSSTAGQGSSTGGQGSTPAWMTSHVARPMKEDVILLIHGAANLPCCDDGSVPTPFCVATTQGEAERGRRAQGITHAAIEPTHCPVYEELVNVEYDQDDSAYEVLMLTIADKKSKEALITYKLPVTHLVPFHPYHLEMVMPSKNAPSGVRLFATLMRRRATLPRDPTSPNYMALEVMLGGFEKPLLNPVGPVTAVARIVPDYYSYKWATQRPEEIYSESVPRSCGLTLSVVTFPSPHPSLFGVSNKATQGYSQVSLPGRPQEQPEWNHSFLFTNTRDKATLFTPGAALVIELYESSRAMTDLSWRLQRPLGFAALLLDQDNYRQVASEGGRLGIRVEGLPVQGTSMKTRTGKMPTLGLILKLVSTERPEATSAPSDREMLPVLEYVLHEEKALFRSEATLKPISAGSSGAPLWTWSESELRSPSPGADNLSRYTPPEEPAVYRQRVLKKPPLVSVTRETAIRKSNVKQPFVKDR